MSDTAIFLRQKFIRLTHWEYWPFDVVYIPVYFYWFWLMLKSRSFFFFNTANPLIKNGGFLMESKKEIYDLMPQKFYPKTILVKPGAIFNDVELVMKNAGLTFPLVAKPDIGMRGLKVAVVKNNEDLQEYMANIKFEFLVQEFVAYENEVGIFYCKMPGSKEGFISGIVEKEFLTVIGDGHSTVAQLLWKSNRGVLQWQVMQQQYGEGLQRVLLSGETLTMVPYGNHSRGAKFVDSTYKIDEKLNATINSICNAIPEFYYGRLDVRFNSWEELKEGKAFSIIELNGAGSEPTHIYDPKHSIFFAWKEIIRHLDILYKISAKNKAEKILSFMTTAEGLAMLKANKQHVALLCEPLFSNSVQRK